MASVIPLPVNRCPGRDGAGTAVALTMRLLTDLECTYPVMARRAVLLMDGRGQWSCLFLCQTNERGMELGQALKDWVM